MHLSTPFALFLLSGTTLASGIVSPNPALSHMLSKRKEGYQPTQRRCGPGNTCATSCGAEYETCASTDGQLHCYDPTIRKQICCPDGTGNACREGYTCTSDSILRTWCCPDGMDLVTCARNYGLTDTLRAQTPTATGTGHVPYGTGNPTPHHSYTYPYPNSSYTYNPTYVTGTAPIPTYYNTTTICPNATTTACVGDCSTGGPELTTTHTPTPVTSLPPNFTGGAAGGHHLGVGWSGVLLAACGFAFLL